MSYLLAETYIRNIWYQIACQIRQKPYQFSGTSVWHRFLVCVSWTEGMSGNPEQMFNLLLAVLVVYSNSLESLSFGSVLPDCS